MDSLASAVNLVWLMYCRVVLSLFAIADTERPVLSSDQIVFCFWLRGEARDPFMLNTVHVNICIFTNI